MIALVPAQDNTLLYMEFNTKQMCQTACDSKYAIAVCAIRPNRYTIAIFFAIQDESNAIITDITIHDHHYGYIA